MLAKPRPYGRILSLAVVCCLAIGCVLACGGRPAASAERPVAPLLLPEGTVAMLRVPDARRLVEQFRQTSLGQVFHDQQVRPFLEHLYGSSVAAYERIQDRLGLSLDQLLAIPQGELCLALVAPEEGTPALVVLVDAGDQISFARQLVQSVQREMERRGAVLTSDTVNDVALTIAQPTANRNRSIVFFEKDQTIGVVTDAELARQILAVWHGAEAKTLADNRDFNAIMMRCGGDQANPPAWMFYVNPIELFRSATTGNPGAQLALLMLGPLGLDGLRGVGGSTIWGDDQFEEISHLHILMDSPREGVLEMLALTSGEVAPEPWVPHQVAGYLTVHWDLSKTVSELQTLYDTLRGEGAFADAVQANFSNRLGVDFQREVLGALGGRFTLVTGTQEPVRFNSQCTLLAVQLQDAEAFRPTLQRILAKAGPNVERQNYVGAEYYTVKQRRTPPNFDAELLRLPQPSFAVLDDYLVYCDSVDFLKQVLLTKKGAVSPLRDELDFRLIASEIVRQAGTGKPCAISFNRPDVALRHFYQFATGDTTRQRLSQMADRNPLFKSLHQAMQERPLPPFEVLAKYFAPGGSLVTNDETGLHMMGFTLKRE